MCLMPRISVIVPIYNVEKYLLEGVESLQKQTYSNLEIILVDDGSPDDCPRICDELAAQDDRIRVVHKKNGGLSDARNAGMQVASGDYVFFMDSDDEITPNCIELHYNAVVKADADFSVANVCIIGSKSAVVRDLNPDLDENQPLKTYLNREWNACAWNKLYRRSFLKESGACFKKDLLHEDVLWSLKNSEYAHKIAVVKEATYLYKIRNDSITTKRVKGNRIDSLLFILQVCKTDWQEGLIPESLKDIFGKFVDYWRFYTALALLRFDGTYGECCTYYSKLKQLKIKNCAFNKYGAFMTLPYIFFLLGMLPILKAYKFVQKL